MLSYSFLVGKSLVAWAGERANLDLFFELAHQGRNIRVLGALLYPDYDEN